MIDSIKNSQGWYRQFCLLRRRRAYSYSLVGTKRPEDLMKPPTKRERIAIVKRFVADGEIENARQLLALINADGSLRNESRSSSRQSDDSNVRQRKN